MSTTASESYTDVVILGGGVAGLALARQLRDADPDIDVTVIEKCAHPLPEATHKVGESTVPVSARYLSDVIGLKEHLESEQFSKLGLRFFPSQDGNRDITRRPELGPRRFPLIPSYQIDRGRLENALGKHALAAGATFLARTRISAVEIGDPHHTVTITNQDGTTRDLTARWLVDASGRAAILKRQLKLGKDVAHTANAGWFRIADRIAVDDWSDDPHWQARVEGGRWLSTVHLHGRGYWVWLIPLASGSTSIGVVADPEFVPFDRIRRFDSMMDWFRENEPQLAEALEDRVDLVQDFLSRKDYARGVTQSFSPQRWFITGDAGFFHDPLYSPGLDFISIANNFIAALIVDGRRGSPDLDERIVTSDFVFRAFGDDAFDLYEGQYGVFGNAEITFAKVTWEQLAYHTLPAPLAFGDPFVPDLLSFFQRIAADLGRFMVLGKAYHAFLRDWDALAESQRAPVGMVATTKLEGMQKSLRAISGPDDLAELIHENMGVLETALQEIIGRVALAVGRELPADEAYLRADGKLGELRLIDLPQTEPADPGEPRSECGLQWAMADAPFAAAADSWAAWPSPQPGTEVQAPPPIAESTPA